jgi:hypothetical protein
MLCIIYNLIGKNQVYRQFFVVYLYIGSSEGYLTAKVRLIYLFFHRFAAAFLAIAFRLAALSDLARALPPLDAPNLLRATA